MLGYCGAWVKREQGPYLLPQQSQTGTPTGLMKPLSPRFTVFLIVLLDVMGFGLIIPSQPFLAKNFGASTATVTLLGNLY